MSFRRLTWIAALAFAALGHSAQAGTITQIDSYGPSPTPFAIPLTFNTFNTSLGTLTSVTVTLTETGTVTSRVINSDTANPQAFTGAFSTGIVTATGPDGTTTSTSLSTTPANGTVPAGSTIVVGTESGTAPTVTTNVPSANFSFFETPPSALTYTINAVGSVTSTGTSPSSDVFFGGGATLRGTVEIVYNYNAVPEPASFAMLALGMGGIFAVRRFFHQTRKTVS